MSDGYCNTCKGYITDEHGGLRCNNCNLVSCINDHCSPAEFCDGHSIKIPYCFKCNPKSKRLTKSKKYLREAITFLKKQESDRGVLSGLYWSLQWAEENKMPKKFIDLLNHKIDYFEKNSELEY